MPGNWTVRRRPAVDEDILAIWCFIGEHDRAAADRLTDRIGDAIARFGEFPHLGRLRDELGDHLYGFAMGNYLIVYSLHEECGIVDVLRIVDARRDLPSLDFDP